MVGLTVLMLSAVMSNFAMAVPTDIIPQELPTIVKDTGTFLHIVTVAINWVFTIFVILAIIFVILAAFQFITGGGDAKNIEAARSKLIWAAVGVVVALIARGLPGVIQSIVCGSSACPT